MRSAVNGWLKRGDANKEAVRKSAARFRSALHALPDKPACCAP
jgi:hypothetical protein